MRPFFTTILVFLTISLTAQNPFPANGEVFKDDVIPRIDIAIQSAYLNNILHPDSNYSNTEYKADFIFDNGIVRDTITDIGFRLRGNTSRAASKKSFKVSFNTFESGRKYHGLEKLNLNGEHNDPSVARSKICWDLLREVGVPAPRANHIDLYINGSYYGLYINVEHIDEEFVDERFGNQDGNLYKCTWPVEFKYVGNNPNLYQNGGYELKTNTDENDFSDLANFITILNVTPIASLACELEKVFNVDSYLKAMAFDVISANWDGPIWNKNNCYLYKNSATGKFEYIPFDLDNTFGISWFPSIDWGTRNIYQWSHSSEPRPIYERILQVQEFKDRYSYYVNEMLQNHFNSGHLYPKIDQLKTMISPSVSNDIYRTYDYGFTFNDFNNSFTQAINYFHTTYGIKGYISTRHQSANSQLILNDIQPILSDLKTEISIENQELSVELKGIDDQPNMTILCWISEDGSGYNSFQLYDDGNHNDGQANDGIYKGTYTFTIPYGEVNFYIEATDNQNQVSRFPRCDYVIFNYNPALPKLVINEILASNDNVLADEAGEFDDWIELYNADNQPIYLKDKYLSDNPNVPNKWELPDVILGADQYLLIWADEDGNQGNTHANFKLSKSGETLGIYSNADNGFAPIDVIQYPEQTTDVTYGRIPNGTGDFQVLSQATPNANNETDTIIIDPPITATEMLLFPNPFREQLNIKHPYDAPLLKIFNAIGEEVFTQNEIEPIYSWDGKNSKGVTLPSGVYFITLWEIDEEEIRVIETKQVVILRK